MGARFPWVLFVASLFTAASVASVPGRAGAEEVKIDVSAKSTAGKTAKIKVCKVIPYTSQDSLGTKPFNYTINGQAFGPILPGECTYYTRDIPILSAPGVPTVVTVDEVEAPSTTFKVESITVQGLRGMPLNIDLMNGTISFNPGPGVNVVTYTNRALDP